MINKERGERETTQERRGWMLSLRVSLWERIRARTYSNSRRETLRGAQLHARLINDSNSKRSSDHQERIALICSSRDKRLDRERERDRMRKSDIVLRYSKLQTWQKRIRVVLVESLSMILPYTGDTCTQNVIADFVRCNKKRWNWLSRVSSVVDHPSVDLIETVMGALLRKIYTAESEYKYK